MNNIAPKAPLARQANQMAGHGRYGDSQLVHMNPYEVQGLASMSPTGQLTINPVTGQPEAFLPFLAPLIGSALGTAAFGGTALGMAGAGALGAGLATWAESGSLEKGIISGVTGFGLGQMLGAGANVGAEAGANAATEVAKANLEAAGANLGTHTIPDAAGIWAGGNIDPDAVFTATAGGFSPNIPSDVIPFSPQQKAYIDAANAVTRAGVVPGPADMTAAQRMGGFNSGLEGFKAMGAEAMSPSSMLPLTVGMGTMASVEKQEAMDELAKKQLGEDKAYAQEWQDVFDESVAVADRRNQRDGRMPMPSPNRGPYGMPSNPYAGRYNAASGGIVRLNGGGEAFGAAQDAGMGFLPGETAQEAYARLGYIPYNSSPYYSTDDYNNYTGSGRPASGPQDTTFGLGAGSAGTIEGDQTTVTDNSTPQTLVASTAAGVDSLVNQGAPLTNIRASDGSASGALSDAWADEMGGEIRGTTTGLDADNRYFVKTTPNSGAERQSFLRGDFKQKPPTDYRHGFEKEFQFFDYVEDRPIERYADLFGAGASDYLAGLLGGNTGNAPTTDTTTVAEAGDFSGTTGGITNTAGGIENLETESIKVDCYTSNDDGTYTISKSDIYGVCPLGSYNTQAAADGAVVIDDTVVDGDSTVVDDDTVVVDDDSTVVDTPATEVVYDAAGNEHEVQAGWTNSTVASYLADGELTAAEMEGINNLLELSSDEGDAAIMGTFDAFDGSFGDSFQDYLDSLAAADDTVVDPLAAFGTDIDSATEAEVTSLVSMINSGATTIDAVAARYGTTPAAVQAYLDSLDDDTIVETTGTTAGTTGTEVLSDAGTTGGTGTSVDDTVAVDDVLDDFGTDTGIISQEEIVSLVDLINSGDTSVADVAARYGKTEAEVQAEYDRLMAQRATNVAAAETEDDPLADYEGIAKLQTQEDINSMVDGVLAGDFTAQDIATRFNVDVNDVLDEIETITSNRGLGTTAAADTEVVIPDDTVVDGTPTPVDGLLTQLQAISPDVDGDYSWDESKGIARLIESGADSQQIADYYGITVDELHDSYATHVQKEHTPGMNPDTGTHWTQAELMDLVRAGTHTPAEAYYMTGESDGRLPFSDEELVSLGYTDPYYKYQAGQGYNMWNPVTESWVDESLNALSEYGTDTGIVTQEDISGLVDLIDSGKASVAQVARRYNKPIAEVQAEYDRLMAQRATNEAVDPPTQDAREAGNRGGLIQQYITETFGEGPYTAEEAIQFSEVAIQNGVSAQEVADALSIDVATVQSFYDQVAPDYVTDDIELGEAGAAGGGRVGTRRFMTRMGPVELADGGIADIPADGQFMQEMPPEVAMVQEALMVEEPPEVDYDDLVALTVEAVKGNIEDADSIINLFIEEYGVEKFRELREAVLQSIVPNAQTEGRIKGSGGGMDDEVMGMIGESQQVAVSPDEYIVAADVVSGLGDGSSDAGADVLDELMANVRTARSGGRQPAPINLSRVMPA